MERREAGNQPKIHRAQDVRGGEIILRSRRRRIIFIAGLIGFVLLALILRIAAGS